MIDDYKGGQLTLPAKKQVSDTTSVQGVTKTRNYISGQNLSESKKLLLHMFPYFDYTERMIFEGSFAKHQFSNFNGVDMLRLNKAGRDLGAVRGNMPPVLESLPQLRCHTSTSMMVTMEAADRCSFLYLPKKNGGVCAKRIPAVAGSHGAGLSIAVLMLEKKLGSGNLNNV